MATTTYYTTTLTSTACGVCNIPFAIPTNLYDRVRETGAWFWCPNGHKIHYFEDENTKLRKELEEARRSAIRSEARADQNWAEAEHQRRRVAATRGVLTKTKKRIGKGVCPCCNRHFVNVERHMENQHPEYVSEEP